MSRSGRRDSTKLSKSPTIQSPQHSATALLSRAHISWDATDRDQESGRFFVIWLGTTRTTISWMFAFWAAAPSCHQTWSCACDSWIRSSSKVTIQTEASSSSAYRRRRPSTNEGTSGAKSMSAGSIAKGFWDVTIPSKSPTVKRPHWLYSGRLLAIGHHRSRT